ncbi:uncharacterized protein LOC119435005 [Dermacentor silvarum]|uniref:uncharacterized protein LOC119435005 n=1 Tax=Dermacentor silvarum TaxID=543639 RepID=UPI00189B2632|nr:uncharacterized protein LOC119435005 [Dermacentor silvarum]
MDISSLWRLDTLVVQYDPDGKHGTHIALEEFERHVSKKGGRYEVPVLILEPVLDAGHNNFPVARQRLLMQLRRFKQQAYLLAEYDKTIQTYFDECHAERVPDKNVPFMPNTYYMPHHGVIRRDAVTTKLRVAFDASSHAPGQPALIIACLSKAQKMDADSLNLLLNFRFHPFVIVADIKKEYLQMVIRREGRDALPFLWMATQHQPLPLILQ